ncbi:Holliday junction endonuclease RuvC [Hydrocarboniphaga daqingensis]|uniref:Crossover junction endodeoxyribonuclease RuvC n=1 Tax=Hydrocarboniphaga daqingensis TaxID=490188 RepID=A0A1M5RT11_9GAMM|nr:crossover junction endodeoxyribonuclease RuvC [Hydrocarboniphaga daqingensis]SHH29427.1 Holliday junction endonuclease RuvC [Hydrocarboniphaga daqingensis]
MGAPVRILGIDPGSRHTGWGVIDSSGHKSQYVAHGCLSVGDGELPARLLQILQGLAAVIAEFGPQEIALEETFVNRANPQSALVLGQARGAAICAVAGAGLPLAEYAAAQVKMAIVGNGRADKAQVQHMVKVLLNLQAKLGADASDALAVALTHAHVRGTRIRAGMALSKSWG